MKIKRMLVTPAMAKKWLEETNTNNRKERPGVRDRYARDMREGRWLDTGDPIRFDIGGRLLDGQHRLGAIVDSGVSLTLVVIRDLGDGVWSGIDGGVPRRLGDFLPGQSYKNTLAGAVRLMWMADRGAGLLASRTVPTRQEALAYFSENATLTDSVEKVMARRCPLFGSQTFLAFFFHASRQKHEEKALAFLDGLSTGVDLRQGSPILALRKRCEEERVKGASGLKGGSTPMQYLLVQCWRAFRDGRRLMRASLPKNYEFASADLDPRL